MRWSTVDSDKVAPFEFCQDGEFPDCWCLDKRGLIAWSSPSKIEKYATLLTDVQNHWENTIVAFFKKTDISASANDKYHSIFKKVEIYI